MAGSRRTCLAFRSWRLRIFLSGSLLLASRPSNQAGLPAWLAILLCPDRLARSLVRAGLGWGLFVIIAMTSVPRYPYKSNPAQRGKQLEVHLTSTCPLRINRRLCTSTPPLQRVDQPRQTRFSRPGQPHQHRVTERGTNSCPPLNRVPEVAWPSMGLRTVTNHSLSRSSATSLKKKRFSVS